MVTITTSYIQSMRKQTMLALLLVVVCSSLLISCAGEYKYSTIEHRTISLASGGLSENGVAFITPSTITGLEQDIQALALTFSTKLNEIHPDVRIVPLSDTLSGINKAGIIADYKKMYISYSETGIFDKNILQKISEVTDTRYLAQLKLASFSQEYKGRFSIFGYRLLETKIASIRLFLQIWDSKTGEIAWEGSQELTYSYDSFNDNKINFKTLVEMTAKNLIERLPRK